MRVIASKLLALLLLSVGGVVGCAPIEIEYRPATASLTSDYGIPAERHPVAPAQVAVFDRESPPWEYDVIGSLQEVHRDSVPGGRSARHLVLREAAAERGCDGVVMNGNVSVFDGRYEYRAPHRRTSDKSRRGGWFPVLDLKGEGADCVVRRGAPQVERLDPEEETGWAAVVPTDYSFLKAGHY